MADTIISFRGEDRGAQTLLDRLRQKAEDLSQSVLRGAVEEARALGSVTKSLEDQLKNLERRKSIEIDIKKAAAERFKAERIANASNIMEVTAAETQFEKKIGRIGKEEQDFKTQTKLLKDILEAIKETSRKEIASDRETVLKTLEAYESGQLKNLSSEEELKLQYQRELLKSRGGGEAAGTGAGKGAFWGSLFGTALGSNLRGIAGHVSSILQQPNEFYMMASSIPFVGSLITKGLGEAEGFQQGLGAISQMYGGHWRGYSQGAIDFSRNYGGTGFAAMGYSYPQIFEDINASARALGGVSLRNAAGLMTGKQAFGFQEADLLEALRMQRGGTTDLFGMMSLAIGGGSAAGIFKGGNLTLLPEYFKVLNEVNKQQLNVLGEISEGINVSMVSAIASLDEAFQNPEILAQLIPSLVQGLRQASTPQVEALQYASLARLQPGVSLWEMEKLKSAPLSAVDEATGKSYLETFLQTLFQASPGREAFFWNVKGAFGLEPAIAQKLAEGFLGGNINVEEWTGKIEARGMSESDMRQRAIDATGDLAVQTAQLTNTFAEEGDKIIQIMSSMIPLMELIGDGLVAVVDFILRISGGSNNSNSNPWPPPP